MLNIISKSVLKLYQTWVPTTLQVQNMAQHGTGCQDSVGKTTFDTVRIETDFQMTLKLTSKGPPPFYLKTTFTISLRCHK